VALSEKTDKKCKSEDKKPEFYCAVQKIEPERSLSLELGRILSGINLALAGHNRSLYYLLRWLIKNYAR
jgi:hypothetical protein